MERSAAAMGCGRRGVSSSHRRPSRAAPSRCTGSPSRRCRAPSSRSGNRTRRTSGRATVASRRRCPAGTGREAGCSSRTQQAEPWGRRAECRGCSQAPAAAAAASAPTARRALRGTERRATQRRPPAASLAAARRQRVWLEKWTAAPPGAQTRRTDTSPWLGSGRPYDAGALRARRARRGATTYRERDVFGIRWRLHVPLGRRRFCESSLSMPCTARPSRLPSRRCRTQARRTANPALSVTVRVLNEAARCGARQAGGAAARQGDSHHRCRQPSGHRDLGAAWARSSNRGWAPIRTEQEPICGRRQTC